VLVGENAPLFCNFKAAHFDLKKKVTFSRRITGITAMEKWQVDKHQAFD
tara:strand:+ start:475 stop:621 length:147 start_codon:yes stop_codon:yes gene_type:complete